MKKLVLKHLEFVVPLILLWFNFGYGQNSGIVTSGLVLQLDASNSSSYNGSGTTWSDLTGNGYNGSILNGTFFDSQDKKFFF